MPPLERDIARQRVGSAAIVLAAGRATRMGEEKLLVPLMGKPLLQHALDALSGVDAIVLVVRPDLDLTPIALPAHCEVVVNHAHAQGMSTSWRTGLLAIEAEIYLLCLGDMPRVPASVIDTLIAAHAASQKPIVLPVYRGQHGHPVLLAASARAELVAETGDKGARALIRRRPELVHSVEVEHPGVVFDIDTPDDLARALSEDPA